MAPPASIPTVLQRILHDKRLQVRAARARVSEIELKRRGENRDRRNFLAALRHPRHRGAPAVIAELKRSSPSRGRMREVFHVADLAAGYEAGGAAALSVLTEEDHFEGELDFLRQAREATLLPILRKDFLFCSYQVWEAAANGADAILLIAAMLDDDSLHRLLATARQADLAALCEVHDAAELARVAAAGADCIGINHRNLHTLAMDPELGVRLAPRLPAGVVAVAESGLRGSADLARMARAGFHAVLIGEAFMQAAHPGQALAALLRPLTCEPAPPPPGFVKICGVTNREDARIACAAGADAVGFVFAPSPRQVTPEQVRAITPHLRADVLRVGVFAGTPVAEIRGTAAACGLHAAQLHGEYAPADAAWLARRLPVWRALAMPDEAASAADWAPVAERFVLDAAVAGRSGGTGATFDWESAHTLVRRFPALPMLVAGGLNPGNVADAIHASHAAGVDVSSGVEFAPGKKNERAVADFVAAARAAFTLTACSG